jgi:hypothetical protein
VALGICKLLSSKNSYCKHIQWRSVPHGFCAQRVAVWTLCLAPTYWVFSSGSDIWRKAGISSRVQHFPSSATGHSCMPSPFTLQRADATARREDTAHSFSRRPVGRPASWPSGGAVPVKWFERSPPPPQQACVRNNSKLRVACDSNARLHPLIITGSAGECSIVE